MLTCEPCGNISMEVAKTEKGRIVGTNYDIVTYQLLITCYRCGSVVAHHDVLARDECATTKPNYTQESLDL